MRYARSTVNPLPRPPPFQRRKVNKHPLPPPLHPYSSQKINVSYGLFRLEIHIVFGLRPHDLQLHVLNFFNFTLKCLKKLSLPGGEDLQYMKYDIIVLETSFFVRPLVNEKPAFSKIFTLESVFDKIRFQWPRHQIRIEKQPHWAVTLSYEEWPFYIFPII